MLPFIRNKKKNNKDDKKASAALSDAAMSSQEVYLFAVFKLPSTDTDQSSQSSENSEPQGEPLYLTPSRDIATNAVMKYLFVDHFDHYKNWCGYHIEGGYSPSTCAVTSAAWKKYVQCTDLLDSQSNPYRICKISYSTTALAAILRMFVYGVPPLALPGESPEEYESIAAIVPVADFSAHKKTIEVLSNTDPLFADNLAKAATKIMDIDIEAEMQDALLEALESIKQEIQSNTKATQTQENTNNE